jgi:ribosomal protein S27AE
MSEEEKVQEPPFTPKIKECPWCGSKEGLAIHNMETNYFLFGIKGNNLDELKSMNPPELFGKLTDFPVLPITCPRCGYTIFLNRIWKQPPKGEQ